MTGPLFDLGSKRLVWLRTTTAAGLVYGDPEEWRTDVHGQVLRFTHHGDRTSPHGWELDHYPIPKSRGGSDDLTNLRALHWRTNAIHGGLLSGVADVGPGQAYRGLFG